jgi:cell division protein FtsI/penicillin-binding protein 2
VYPRAEDLALPRLRLFARVCLLWALLLFARLFQLQVVEHHEYVRLAQQQQERNVELRAPRGNIFDRNGSALAMSVPVESVCINPLRVPDPAIAADILAQVLHLDPSDLLEKINTAVSNRRGFLWIKRRISHEEADSLRSYKFDWVEFRPESSRF